MPHNSATERMKKYICNTYHIPFKSAFTSDRERGSEILSPVKCGGTTFSDES